MECLNNFNFPKDYKKHYHFIFTIGDMNRLVVLLFTYLSYLLRKTVVSGSFQTLGICITPLSHKYNFGDFFKIKIT